METFDGIMIATTNLTSNLDAAFDRRFLYKVEFLQPTTKERQHIWLSMLPELSAEDAMSLAARYDFSGGQIENIARKLLVNSILRGNKEQSLECLVSDCDYEKLQRSGMHKVMGFR